MSQDIISMEDCIFLTHCENRSKKLYIGKVKDRNDFSGKLESGVWTTFDFKLPLNYNGEEYSAMSVVTFIVNENNAQTNVWGRPKGMNCLGEKKLEELCKAHKPYELPKIHEQTVELIDQLHYKMHEKILNDELKKAETEELTRPKTYEIPF